MTDHDHHDGDFATDLSALLSRRRMLTGLGLAGLTGLVGVAALAQGRPPMGPGAQPDVTGLGADGQSCVAQPEETNGPFPADGTNVKDGQTVNALTLAGVIRSDIRGSIGDLTGTAEGQAMTLTLDLVDVDAACAPLPGLAVYVWHCDAGGRYSIYEVADQNYLRGMQIADARGRVSFTTILPGTYRGRWPHIHFEVFRSADAAVAGEAAVLTGQLALPETLATARYADDPRYADSLPNLAGQSLSADGIFGDSTPLQLAAQLVKVSQTDAGLAVGTQVGLTGL